jgi:trans-aconitate methyltransferase
MYSWNPEEYSCHSTEQAKWARELIAKLNLQGTERVLDIGCGDGKVTAELASSLPQSYSSASTAHRQCLPDEEGFFRLAMVRLEVEAVRES